MMIAQLVVLALVNAQLKLSPKAIFMLLTVTFAPIAAHALMCALLKQSTLNNIELCSLMKTRFCRVFFVSQFFCLYSFQIIQYGLNIC
jgi:hypothetical protein